MIEVASAELRDVTFRLLAPDGDASRVGSVTVDVLDDVLVTSSSTVIGHGRVVVPLDGRGEGRVALIAGTACRYVIDDGDRAVTVTVPAGTAPVNYDILPEG